MCSFKLIFEKDQRKTLMIALYQHLNKTKNI